MTDVLRIQSTDDAAIAWDLSDTTGANNPYGVKTYIRDGGLDLGEPPPERTLVGGPAWGDRDLHYRLPSTEMRVLISVESPNADYGEVTRALWELNRILVTGGAAGGYEILKQLEDDDEPFTIDFLRSPPLSLFRGSATDVTLPLHGRITDLEVVIRRQPWLRGALLDSDTNLLDNATALVDSNDDGTPDSLAFDSVANVIGTSIQPATESFDFTVTSETLRVLQQTQDLNADIEGNTYTFSFEGLVGGTGRVGARIEFLDSAGAQVGADNDSALSTPTSFAEPDSPEDRVKMTATAPATAEQVRVSAICHNSAAGDGTYKVRRFQLEEATAPTRYVCPTEQVSNDPALAFGGFAPIFIHGDAEAPVELTFAPTGGSVIEAMVSYRGSEGRGGGNSVADLFNRAGLMQFSGTADGDASGGEVGTAARQTITSNLDALRGDWRVLARYPSLAVGNDLGLRWGAGLLDPAPEKNLTLTGRVATADADLDLGRITIPEAGELEGIVLHPSANPPSVDYLLLVPAERVSRLVVLPASRQSSLDGVTEGGGDVILDANAEQTTYTVTRVTGERYRAMLRYSIEDAGASTDLDLTLRTGSGAGWATIATATVTGAVDDENNAQVVLEGVATGGVGTDLQLLVVLTTAGGATVTVHEIILEHLPTVGSTRLLRSDPEWGPDREPRTHVLNASEQFVVEAGLRGGETPLRATPGLGAVFSRLYDVRGGNTDTEPASVLTRAWTLRHRYYPRYLT